MRRKPGSLLSLETAVCAAAINLLDADIDEFHGYQLAKLLADVTDRRLLTAYGTLYRTLARLEGMGLLASTWEDPTIAAKENRPGRRLYKLTPDGKLAALEARKTVAERVRKVPTRKWAPA